jgi:hypothetical protein
MTLLFISLRHSNYLIVILENQQLHNLQPISFNIFTTKLTSVPMINIVRTTDKSELFKKDRMPCEMNSSHNSYTFCEI